MAFETPVPTMPPDSVGSAAPLRRGKAAASRLSLADRVTVSVMVLVPTVLVLALVWVPGILSVVLSFTRWEGIGGIDTIQWIGTENWRLEMTAKH